jgi:hypothetical protein
MHLTHRRAMGQCDFEIKCQFAFQHVKPSTENNLPNGPYNNGNFI